MKQVTFTRDMRPFGAGDKRLVPDDVAARLVAEGVVEANPSDFPCAPPASTVQAVSNHLTRRGRRTPAQHYETK